jgi:hypothetical protein
VHYIYISNVTEGNELQKLLRLCGNKTPQELRQIFSSKIGIFRVTYQNSRAIDAGGVRRTFFTNVANQIFEKGFFKKLDDTGDIYTFNNDVDNTEFIVQNETDNRPYFI